MLCTRHCLSTLCVLTHINTTTPWDRCSYKPHLTHKEPKFSKLQLLTQGHTVNRYLNAAKSLRKLWSKFIKPQQIESQSLKHSLKSGVKVSIWSVKTSEFDLPFLKAFAIRIFIVIYVKILVFFFYKKTFSKSMNAWNAFPVVHFELI